MAKISPKQFFITQLLKWNGTENKRQMPWKGEKDPYKIWLSEIILQQTRVDQGLDYYNRFIKQYPTISKLAAATDEKVFKLWEGLGYYTRCKNLIATARHISADLNDKFPNKYHDILALKGVGPYTAAAIGSFAFNLPYAVVDGNVFRVLSRYFGIKIPIDSVNGKKVFTELADELLDKKEPGMYNQALMDFGAIVCKPQLPLCIQCPFNKQCVAFTNEAVNNYPVKEKTIAKKTRWFYYIVLTDGSNFFVKKRGQKDIWENLYEFMMVEKTAPVSIEELANGILPSVLPKQVKYKVETISAVYKQQLTHQTIFGQFIRVKIRKGIEVNGYQCVDVKALSDLPFPKFISNYLKDKTVSLNLF